MKNCEFQNSNLKIALMVQISVNDIYLFLNSASYSYRLKYMCNTISADVGYHLFSLISFK